MLNQLAPNEFIGKNAEITVLEHRIFFCVFLSYLHSRNDKESCRTVDLLLILLLQYEHRSKATSVTQQLMTG